jgi:hypothetical protein
VNVRETIAEKANALKFWKGLDRRDRFELGDQFVLGTFDWRDWFTKKPSRVFLDEVDRERILWECENE